MDSLFVYNIVQTFGMSPALTGLLTTIIIAVIGYVINELKHKFQAPKIAQANITAGILTGAGIMAEEPKDIGNSNKANHVSRMISNALVNPAIPEVDTRVDKAINKAGGVLNLLSQGISLLKLVNAIKK